MTYLVFCLRTYLPTIMAIDTTTQTLIIVLKSIGKPASEISKLIGVPVSTINSTYARTIQRGFDPAKRPLEIDTYLVHSRNTQRQMQEPAILNETPTGEKYVSVGEEKKLVLIWLARTGPKTTMLRPLTSSYLRNL